MHKRPLVSQSCDRFRSVQLVKNGVVMYQSRKPGVDRKNAYGEKVVALESKNMSIEMDVTLYAPFGFDYLGRPMRPDLLPVQIGKASTFLCPDCKKHMAYVNPAVRSCYFTHLRTPKFRLGGHTFPSFGKYVQVMKELLKVDGPAKGLLYDICVSLWKDGAFVVHVTGKGFELHRNGKVVSWRKELKENRAKFAC